MTTIAKAQAQLEQWRRSLEAPFKKAKEAGDTDEMARLEGIATEIDDLLDELALIGLAQLATELTKLKKKIEGHTADVSEIASGFGALSAAEIEKRVKAIFRDSSEEQLPDAEDASTADPGVEVDAAPDDEPDISGDVRAPDPGIAASGNLVLTEAHLIALWKRSQFPISGGGTIVFGLRGCQPVDHSGTGVAMEHEIVLSPINYKTMNCTLGQWQPSAGFAVFPGSTVPYGATVNKRIGNNGIGVNQMGRGRYKRYQAGWHKRSEGKNGHWALQQDCAITIQRTADDADFDLEDRWEVGRIAGDNIHCAFHMGVDENIPDSRFSSAGCQTVAGTVKKGVKGSERGPWKKFIAPFLNILGNQKSAEYVLFNAFEVQRMIKTQCQGSSVILRMGSAGPLVKELQKALGKKLNRTIKVDGDFGPTTFQSIIDFQTDVFGDNADDGIVGSETAAELGFELPEFDFADAIAGGPGFKAAPIGAPPAPPAGGDTSSDDEAIAWGAVTNKKHGTAFKKKVVEISRRLKCDPSHLMAVMAFETGNKFTPDVKNQAGSGAIGLIQFMPNTAVGLGTTTKKLAKMTAVEQLDFVEKHFKSVVGTKPLRTLSDVYMAVLLPSKVGKHDNHTLFTKPSTAYTQNKGLDANKDGVITKGEAASKVQNKLNLGLKVGKIG